MMNNYDPKIEALLIAELDKLKYFVDFKSREITAYATKLLTIIKDYENDTQNLKKYIAKNVEDIAEHNVEIIHIKELLDLNE